MTVIGTGCMADMQKSPCNTSNPLTHLVSARICFAFNLDLIWLFFFSMQGDIYLLVVVVFFNQNDLQSAKDCMKFQKVCGFFSA